MDESKEKKVFEVFNRGVRTMVIGILMESMDWREQSIIEQSGFSVKEPPAVMLVNPFSGEARVSSDAWQDRSMRIAHQYLEGYWDTLQSGDTIDIEWLFQEKEEPCKSERYVNSL